MRRSTLVFCLLVLLLGVPQMATGTSETLVDAVLISNCDCQTPVADDVLMDVDACSMSDCISSVLLNMGVHMAPAAWYEYNEIFEFKEEPEEFTYCYTRRLTGEPIFETVWDGALQEVDIRCPSWFEHVWDGIEPVLAASFGANQDNVACTSFFDGGISEATLEVFPAWLFATYSTAELSSLGIDDPSSFNVIDYLLRNGLDNGNPSAPQDSIWRTWVMYDYSTNLATWRRLQERAQDLGEASNRDAFLFGNQGSMWAVTGSSPYSVLLSQYTSIVEIEHVLYVDPLPPYKHSSLVSKVGRASATQDQPVWIRGILYDWEQDAPYYSRDLARLAVSEGYANGARRVIELMLSSPHGDLPLPSDMYDGLVDIGGWIQRYGIYEGRSESVADVALIYSVPTLMWRQYPPTGHQNWAQTFEFSGWARVMEEEHIPYDVVIFGHPLLWDDGNLQATLARYSTVVLPMVDCITDAQLAALDAFAAAGGTVITSGEFATRNEDFEARQTAPSSRPTIVPYVRGLDAQAYYGGLQHGIVKSKERDALASFLDPLIRPSSRVITDAGPNVAVNLLRGADGNLQVHLVNYNYDEVTRQSLPQPPFTVSVALDAEEIVGMESITWLTPDTEDGIQLPYALENGRIQIEVPGITTYTVLILGNYDLEGRAVERQSELLDLLSEDARPEYAAGLASLEVMIENGEWRDALMSCEELMAEVRMQPSSPMRIAVDQAHENQTSLLAARAQQWYPANPEWFRLSLLEALDAQSIDRAIREADLKDIDILVVPAGWEEMSASEANAIVDFVESGGSLLIIGTCFAPSPGERFADAFGIEIMEACLGFPSSGGYLARSVADHWITQPIAAVWPRATEFIQVDDAWTVLMATDAETYVDRNDSETRDIDEPVGSSAYVAARNFGDGRVAIVADHTLFTSASTAEGSAIAERILRWLAREDAAG